MSDKYINIIGTIIGVFTGWFLGYLSNLGKVRFHFSNSMIEFYESDNAGGFLTTELNNNSDHGKLSFEVDISNTSRNKKVLREIYCLIEIKNSNLLKELFNSDTYRTVASCSHYYILRILSIPSQDILKFKLLTYLNKDNLSSLMGVKADIYFQYLRLYGIRRKKKILITQLQNGKIN